VSYRSVALAVGVALACAGLAVGCTLRAQHLGKRADWLLLRSTAEAAEYTSTFDGRHVDQEMLTFQERRAVLERAHTWERGATTLVMASALLVLASYALFLLARLKEQQLESPEGPSPHAPAPPPSRAAVQVR
jgi:hypothetical protein